MDDNIVDMVGKFTDDSKISGIVDSEEGYLRSDQKRANVI